MMNCDPFVTGQGRLGDVFFSMVLFRASPCYDCSLCQWLDQRVAIVVRSL